MHEKTYTLNEEKNKKEKKWYVSNFSDSILLRRIKIAKRMIFKSNNL